MAAFVVLCRICLKSIFKHIRYSIVLFLIRRVYNTLAQSMKYRRKRIIGVIVVVLIILLGIGVYYSWNWKSTVKTRLTETIAKSTNGLYALKYDDIDLNILAGNLTLKNAELIPDSAVYRTLVAAEEAPNNRFHVKLSLLKITRLSIWNILVAKKINIKHISFDTAVVHVIHEQHLYNDSLHTRESKTLYDKIKDVFKTVKVGKVTIDNINFKLSTIEKGKAKKIELDSIRVAISDFLLDSTSIRDTTRLFYAKEIEVDVPRFEYEIPNSVYKIKFDHLTLNTKSQNALITKVELAPRISKLEYFKRDKKNKAMIVLKWDTVKLAGLRFNEIIANQLVYSQYAYIKNGSASFHKDKRYQKDNISKIGQAPHQAILKLDQRIQCDTVFVENVDISYHQYSAKFDQEGTITFQQAKGNITNVTNDSAQLAKDKFMQADLRAKVMGTGVLQTQFGFDMLSKIGSYTYRGTLGKMQAPAFNKILTPLLNLEFGSGNIHGVSFNMQGTDYKNWGEFRFDYDDLKINLFYAPGSKGKRTKKGVLSFVVNEVLIDDRNPSANGKYRIGQVDYTRVPEYSFFKTIWKSLFEGIQQCVGMSKSIGGMLKGEE